MSRDHKPEPRRSTQIGRVEPAHAESAHVAPGKRTLVATAASAHHHDQRGHRNAVAHYNHAVHSVHHMKGRINPVGKGILDTWPGSNWIQISLAKQDAARKHYEQL
jgi:hypothetical protein